MKENNGNAAVIESTPSGNGGAFVDAHIVKADKFSLVDGKGNVAFEIPPPKENEATNLLNKLGVSGEEQAPKAIPCGYKEPISEGRTVTCGSIYRGRAFYCRDCMTQMLDNAHEIANGMAELMLVAVSDHDIDGKVAESTVDTMRTFLTNIGSYSGPKV